MTGRRSKGDSFPRLILVRHAHRDTSHGRERDNGLSPKGVRQADAFGRWGRSELPLEETVLASSPKRRCVETLEPLERPIRVWTSLGEQRARETDAAFRRRVAGALQSAKRKKAGAVVLSSHGDWLPIAAELLLGRCLEWKKGSWKEFRFRAPGAALAAELVE